MRQMTVPLNMQIRLGVAKGSAKGSGKGSSGGEHWQMAKTSNRRLSRPSWSLLKTLRNSVVLKGTAAVTVFVPTLRSPGFGPVGTFEFPAFLLFEILKTGL